MLLSIAVSIIFFNSVSLKSGAIFNHTCKDDPLLFSIVFLSLSMVCNSFESILLVCRFLSLGVLGEDILMVSQLA